MTAAACTLTPAPQQGGAEGTESTPRAVHTTTSAAVASKTQSAAPDAPVPPARPWSRTHVAFVPVDAESWHKIDKDDRGGTLDGKRVWLDLRNVKARESLATVDSAIGLTIAIHQLAQPAVFDPIVSNAARHEVGLTLVRDVNHTQGVEERNRSPDLRPLLKLRYLRALSLNTIPTPKFTTLGKLTQLRHLRFYPLNEPGKVPWSRLAALTKMRDFGVRLGSRTRGGATDGLASVLASWSGLTRLFLAGEWITDTTVAPLASLSSLEEIIVVDSKITDVALDKLDKLDKLRWLSVGGSQIRHVPKLAASVEELDMGNTDVADDSLHRLAHLSNLRRLSLARTRVTDAGLKHLSGLTSLQRLDLGDTKVTDAGVNKLRGVLPGAKISRD